MRDVCLRLALRLAGTKCGRGRNTLRMRTLWFTFPPSKPADIPERKLSLLDSMVVGECARRT